MELQLSPHAAAVLLHRVAIERLSPVAKAAQRHERRMARHFLREVRRAQDAIPMRELEDALRLPGTGAALYVLGPVIDMLLEETHLTTPLEQYVRAAVVRDLRLADIYKAALKAGANAQPIRGMKFDEANPAAVDWAEREAAKLVTAVTEDARRAIRAVITEGIDAGVPVDKTAQIIRASIGLTERDAAAVMKRQIELMQGGMSPADAASRAERYAAKLTRSRSMTIARTETMRASNEGQEQLWSQAREAGLLTGRERKVWIVADPCPICAALDGERVGLDEDFSIGSDPPAHPNCRCTIGIVHG